VRLPTRGGAARDAQKNLRPRREQLTPGRVRHEPQRTPHGAPREDPARREACTALLPLAQPPGRRTGPRRGDRPARPTHRHRTRNQAF